MSFDNLQVSYSIEPSGFIAIGNSCQATGANSIAVGRYVTSRLEVDEMIEELKKCLVENNSEKFRSLCDDCFERYAANEKEIIKRGIMLKLKDLSVSSKFIDIFYGIVFPHEGRHTKAAR